MEKTRPDDGSNAPGEEQPWDPQKEDVPEDDRREVDPSDANERTEQDIQEAFE